MTNEQYLHAVLASQDLTEAAKSDLLERRAEIESFLRKELGAAKVSIRWAGSWAKQTMIRESYDADLVVYVHHDETALGESLEDIYEWVENRLIKAYSIYEKSSAIRVLNSTTAAYTHVDIVPGRFFDDTKGDAWLHRTDGDKMRFKTNLDTHVQSVRHSQHRELARLLKYWFVRHGISCKSFVIELLAVKLGTDSGSNNLVEKFCYVMEQFADSEVQLQIWDPANPNGNDLSDYVESVRSPIQYFATQSIAHIAKGDFDSIFGPIPTSGDEQKKAVAAAIVHQRPTSEPWLRP